MGLLSVPFEFTNPYGLFFLLILVPVVYLWLRSLSPLPPWREKLSLLSRVIMVLCLVFALSEMRWIWKVDQLAVIFVLDISESINTYSQDQAIQWINQACKGMTEKDRAALIVFGTNAYIDLPLQPRLKISEITSIPERNFTDISRAIRLALASFPENTQKKVILLTDGNENLGNALNEALIAKSNNVKIYSKKINQAPEVEVLLDQIILPSEVRLKQAFDLKLIIKSFQETKTKVRIYRNERYLGEEVLSLDPGTNILKIPQRVEEPGFVNYEIHLEPQDDTIRYNNQMTGFTLVQGESRILYLEGKEGKSEYLHSVLQEAGLRVDVRSQFEIPTTLPELNNYDCVILSDIPSNAFSSEQMIFFKRYVEDMGGGLIMVGGEDSFGVGLYQGTPIEEVLPVNMEVRQKKHLASMAMVIVIDQSGSMSMTVPDGRTKLQLA
ncbi:MAG: VWA domain-containing protein, partial [Planctomycetota bacterium]